MVMVKQREETKVNCPRCKGEGQVDRDTCLDENKILKQLYNEHTFRSVALESTFLKTRVNIIRQLSPRQTEILFWVASGLENKQIARLLYITPHTVHSHMQEIRYRLRATSRAHAVAIGVACGIIGHSDLGEYVCELKIKKEALDIA
jgi:DNA-binding CsgD family transcriptional regulator